MVNNPYLDALLTVVAAVAFIVISSYGLASLAGQIQSSGRE